jgi:hypothetical protein
VHNIHTNVRNKISTGRRAGFPSKNYILLLENKPALSNYDVAARFIELQHKLN